MRISATGRRRGFTLVELLITVALLSGAYVAVVEGLMQLMDGNREAFQRLDATLGAAATFQLLDDNPKINAGLTLPERALGENVLTHRSVPVKEQLVERIMAAGRGTDPDAKPFLEFHRYQFEREPDSAPR